MRSLIQSEQKFGTIARKNQNTLWISIQPDNFGNSDSDSGCEGGGCSSCSGGGSCGGKSNDPQQVMISNCNAQNYSVGDKVTFIHKTLNENLVAFIVFGIPIILALGTILAWYAYSPQKAESPLAIICAGLSLVLGILIVRAIDTWFRTRFPSQIISSSPRKDFTDK